jgi:hypothetical protein
MNIKLPRLHPDTWAKDLLCEKFITEADKSKIIIIMYSVWDSRNKWTHGEVGYNLRWPWSLLEILCYLLRCRRYKRLMSLGAQIAARSPL